MNLVDIPIGGSCRDTDFDDEFMPAKSVRRYFGDISDMTLWRWLQTRGFPQPDMTIGKLRYWRRRTIKSWQPKEQSATEARTGAA